MISQTVYLLCAGTSLGCALLLARAYRANRVPLLLWSLICFIAFTVTNVLLVLDLIVFPGIDLQSLRSVVTLAGVIALLYGLTLGE